MVIARDFLTIGKGKGMGFSITGTIIAAVMLLPNIIYLFFPPQNVPESKKDAGLFFTVLERVGQIVLIVLLAVSHDSLDGRAFDVWAVLMVVCIAVYYGLWLRYFLKGRQYGMLYRPMLTLPVPMAVFPVFAFAFAGVWGNSLLLLAASVVFALGHIPNSLRKARLFQ